MRFKNMNLKFYLVIAVLFLIKYSYGFNPDDFPKYFYNIEDTLQIKFELLAQTNNDIQKEALCSEISILFKKVLENNNSFDFRFRSLKYVGIIYSPDLKFRIIQWNLPYNDGTHKYFGFIQYHKSKRKTVLIELHDKSDLITKPQLEKLSSKNWYGALYYKIIHNTYKENEYYTLLGSDLNNMFTKKKIIEILTFDRKGNPSFGAMVFKNQNKPAARIIFEYSIQANMVLTYDQNKEMIIFDHLSPSRPSLVGRYEFYGPDFSYDGMKFERGIWNYYPDLDIRNYNIE